MRLAGSALGQIEIDGNKSLSIRMLFTLSATFLERLLDAVPVPGIRYIKEIEPCHTITQLTDWYYFSSTESGSNYILKSSVFTQSVISVILLLPKVQMFT